MQSIVESMLNNNWNQAKLLIQQGCDPNEKGGRYTPLSLACVMGKIDVVNMLLAASAEIYLEDMDGCTALMRAAHGGHMDIVKLLVTTSQDPKYLRKNGNDAYKTELTRALGMALTPNLSSGEYANQAMFKIATFLIEHGADPEQKTVRVL